MMRSKGLLVSTLLAGLAMGRGLAEDHRVNFVHMRSEHPGRKCKGRRHASQRSRSNRRKAQR